MYRRIQVPLLPRPSRWAGLVLALSGALSVAHAEEAVQDGRAELARQKALTDSLINTLVDSGLLSREKAQQLLQQAQEGARPAADAKPAPVIRIPYITEATKTELREGLKQDVLKQAREERWGEPGALPAWLRRLTLEGDVRVRFQHDGFAQSNTAPDDADYGFGAQTNTDLAWGPDVVNTQHNRDRMTLRARLGVHAEMGQGFDAMVRLSTGNDKSPVSASATQGNFSNKYATYFDQAFIRYNDRGELLATAGRFPTPFYGSDLLWPDDLNLDGAAVSGRWALDAGHTAFFTAGAFPLQELEISSRDRWLYGVQTGYALPLASDIQLRTGLGLYDFQGMAGEADTQVTPVAALQAINGYTLTEYPKGVRSKGNTLIRLNRPLGINDGSTTSTWGLASRFRPVNLTAELNFMQFYPVLVRVGLDVVDNLGFDLNDIRRRSGISDLQLSKQTQGVQLKLTVGHDRVEKAGQWLGFVTFRRLERDAWLDAFTDTTWHLGGTNYQGWSLGGQYGVGPRTSMGVRYTTTHNLGDAVVYTPTLSNNATLKIDVFQLEANVRF
ncbi:MAG: hypothetical protein RI907_403 [Pseudomonadota bacterium]